MNPLSAVRIAIGTDRSLNILFPLDVAKQSNFERCVGRLFETIHSRLASCSCEDCSARLENLASCLSKFENDDVTYCVLNMEKFFDVCVDCEIFATLNQSDSDSYADASFIMIPEQMIANTIFIYWQEVKQDVVSKNINVKRVR